MKTVYAWHAQHFACYECTNRLTACTVLCGAHGMDSSSPMCFEDQFHSHKFCRTQVSPNAQKLTEYCLFFHTAQVVLNGHTGWVRALASDGKWLFRCVVDSDLRMLLCGCRSNPHSKHHQWHNHQNVPVRAEPLVNLSFIVTHTAQTLKHVSHSFLQQTLPSMVREA